MAVNIESEMQMNNEKLNTMLKHVTGNNFQT